MATLPARLPFRLGAPAVDDDEAAGTVRIAAEARVHGVAQVGRAYAIAAAGPRLQVTPAGPPRLLHIDADRRNG